MTVNKKWAIYLLNKKISPENDIKISPTKEIFLLLASDSSTIPITRPEVPYK